MNKKKIPNEKAAEEKEYNENGNKMENQQKYFRFWIKREEKVKINNNISRKNLTNNKQNHYVSIQPLDYFMDDSVNSG